MKWYFVACSKADVALLLDEKVPSIFISYAYFKKGVPEGLVKSKTTKNLMLDSGAFTNASKPGHVTLDGYTEYLKEYKSLFDEYITLDSLHNRAETVKNYFKLKERGLNPLPVDHFWYSGTDNITKYYGSGKKICWGAMPNPSGKSPDWLKQYADPSKALLERIDRRYNLAKTSPRTKTHVLMAGQRMRKLLPWIDVVDSFDSTTWKKCRAFGNRGLNVAPTAEKPYPRFLQIRSDVKLPKEFLDKAARYKLNPSKREDIERMTIRELHQFYRDLETFHAKHASSKDALFQAALRKDDSFVFPEEPARIFVPDYIEDSFRSLETKSSGKELGEDVTREDVLAYLDAGFKLRKPFIALTGGLAVRDSTKGDIDILVRAPGDSPELAKSIQHRIERAFPESLRDRLSFITNEGGPFTDYIELYDLSCERVNAENVSIEMRDSSVDLPSGADDLDATHDFELFLPIHKIDEDEQLLTGIVLEPDEVDAQNDTVNKSEIKNAAYRFLAKYNKSTRLGLMHTTFSNVGIELVESWVARASAAMGGKPVKEGSWLMTVHVTDGKLWRKVKEGKITGFSIGGAAKVS